MRVLLTGAAGFVGRPALDLLSRDHQVTAFDIRPVEGWPTVVQADVLDYGAVEAAVAGHDAVVNTIMAPNPAYGRGGPGFTVNVAGLYNLLEAARIHRVRRFVHTSSGVVQSGYPPGTHRGNELYPLKTAGAYGLSKLLQEELTRSFAEQHGMSIAVLRPWDIVDADRMVTTDGQPVAELTWRSIDRRDVASALACALQVPDIAYECLHITATPGGEQATDTLRSERRLGWRAARRFAVER